jgi:hypothetical protein
MGAHGGCGNNLLMLSLKWGLLLSLLLSLKPREVTFGAREAKLRSEAGIALATATAKVEIRYGTFAASTQA